MGIYVAYVKYNLHFCIIHIIYIYIRTYGILHAMLKGYYIVYYNRIFVSILKGEEGVAVV